LSLSCNSRCDCDSKRNRKRCGDRKYEDRSPLDRPVSKSNCSFTMPGVPLGRAPPRKGKHSVAAAQVQRRATHALDGYAGRKVVWDSNLMPAAPLDRIVYFQNMLEVI